MANGKVSGQNGPISACHVSTEKKKKKEREKWLHVGIEASCVNFPRTCVRSACNSIYTARPIAINYCFGKKKTQKPSKILLLWKEFGMGWWGDEENVKCLLHLINGCKKKDWFGLVKTGLVWLKTTELLFGKS